MAFSGINGSNNVLISSVKLRVEKGLITEATIVGEKGNYSVYFTNLEALWKGEPVVLSSARNPYEPKVFKSLDGAIADVERAGLKRKDVLLRDREV